VVALTADEEGGDSNGVKWLLEHHGVYIDAEYVLNEGGGGELKDGKAVAHGVQAAEKKYSQRRARSAKPGGPQLASAERQRHLPSWRRR